MLLAPSVARAASNKEKETIKVAAQQMHALQEHIFLCGCLLSLQPCFCCCSSSSSSSFSFSSASCCFCCGARIVGPR